MQGTIMVLAWRTCGGKAESRQSVGYTAETKILHIIPPTGIQASGRTMYVSNVFA